MTILVAMMQTSPAGGGNNELGMSLVVGLVSWHGSIETEEGLTLVCFSPVLYCVQWCSLLSELDAEYITLVRLLV